VNVGDGKCIHSCSLETLNKKTAYWRYPMAEGRKTLGRILSMRGRELVFSGSERTRFRHTHTVIEDGRPVHIITALNPRAGCSCDLTIHC
jgi:hypothetical protein